MEIRSSDVGAARDREAAAYQRARALVFDRFPAGCVPPLDDLSPEQRAALEELRAAEAEVKRLRYGDDL